MDEFDKEQIRHEYAKLKSLALGKDIDPTRVTVTEKQSFLKLAHVRPSQDWISINPTHWKHAPVELRLRTYTHEIAHHKPKADGHKPSFWQAFEEVFYAYWDSKDTVENILNSPIDWHKYTYNCIDDVSADSVDRRCEEPEERKRKFAESLPYSINLFEQFELEDVRWVSGDPCDTIGFGGDDYTFSVSVNDFEGAPESIDYTDKELLDFLHSRERTEYDTFVVDAPVCKAEYDNEGNVDQFSFVDEGEAIRAALYERVMPTTAHIMFGTPGTDIESEWGERSRVRELCRAGKSINTDPKIRARSNHVD